ncbi:MAG: cystathionine beta-lyase/cystathionine gamma-synthase, partial [Parvicella sp.]
MTLLKKSLIYKTSLALGSKMKDNKILSYIKAVLQNMPKSWLSLTTHRLDIYEEKLAKTQFLEQFETLYSNNTSDSSALNNLPTAYDYIRLGHPLSCVLEWAIAHLNNLKPQNVISFSSQTAPILAVLRKNSLDNKNTQIIYTGELPDYFDGEVLRNVYGYQFDLKQVEKSEEIPAFKGSTIFISESAEIGSLNLSPVPMAIG